LHPNQLLWLRRSILFCVPTGKEELIEGKTPSPTPPRIPADLDHFKCYPQRYDEIRPPSLRREHNFTDQFSNYILVRFEARFLCNPAAKYKFGKIDTDMLHGFAHLVCYGTYPRTPKTRKVRIANQLEPDATLSVFQLEMACFPSTKSVRR